MSEIIYPTLRLFLYDLRNGLGQSHEEIDNNQEYFRQKLPKNIQNNLFQFDAEYDDEYVELLKEPRLERFKDDSKGYKGYYYPVQLHDTYGLLLDCSVDNESSSYSTSCFTSLKAEIEKRLHGKTFTLGQTWMILGYLPSYSTENPIDIAKKCYEAIMPPNNNNWEEDYQGQSKFLGGLFFELWRYSPQFKNQPATNFYKIQDIQVNHHVVIALFPNREMLRKAAEFDYDWLRLFSYRSKIIWAYAQSLLLKQFLKKEFKSIQNYVRNLKGNNSYHLSNKNLGRLLDNSRITLSEYAINFHYLEAQIRTIETNLYSYQQLLSIILEEANQLTTISHSQNENISRLEITDLSVLGNFCRNISEKYLLQTQKDRDNLRSGLQLLEVVIETIQTVITFRQAENDRQFNRTIETLAWGLAISSVVASLVSSSLGEFDSPLEKSFFSWLLDYGVPKDWLTPVSAFLISVISFLIFFVIALGVWFILWILISLFKYLLRILKI